jgi:predicted nucleic acid-binding protein
MAVLLDTKVLSELARPEPDAMVVAYLSQGLVGYVSVVTMHELRYGAELIKDLPKRERLLSWLESIRSTYERNILPVATDIAERAGVLRAGASHQGRTLHVEDALIAATARAHDLTLVTRNTGDFVITGVRMVNPWE